ncbi:hypothetical protein HPB49_025928 [Dermacentor silvarum]|nr:hypothetical protein HPB49_025928 [Dermacentor silvarum]
MDESASPEGGLPAKYQKLAYEYSKLRAQAQVLKKAVADEQAKNAELKDCLKDKDQGMRKLLQEVESLNFCNQQLTKRVSFLQEELEEDRSRKNKKKHHAAATASPMHQGIIDAELQSRIEENEKLHLQVSAAELEHKQTVEKLEMELDKVRQALATHEDQLSDAVGRREEQISRLTQERAKLEDHSWDEHSGVGSPILDRSRRGTAYGALPRNTAATAYSTPVTPLKIAANTLLQLLLVNYGKHPLCGVR